MLIYAIVFCIISLCNSKARAETFSKLVLAQRFPITKFFYGEIDREVVSTESPRFLQYLKDHKTLFQAKNWVLHGLWPLNSTNKINTNCKTAKGEEPRVNYDRLDQELRDALEKQWPVFALNETVKGNMVKQYLKYGSCVSDDAKAYFKKALELLETYNVTHALHTKKVQAPGVYIRLRIDLVLKAAFGTKPLVNCLRPPNAEADIQYLLEIQTCFSSSGDLVDCPRDIQPNELYMCNGRHQINYPEIPQDYGTLLESL